MREAPEYLSEQLITCLGNKRALLPFIGTAVDRVREALGRDRLRVGDLFSGSGAVARYLRQYASYMAVNDLELYAETLSRCYLSNGGGRDDGALRRAYDGLTAALAAGLEPGFLSELYAPKDEHHIRPGERCFYTPRNARYLDTARRLIGGLPTAQQPFFLGPLLAEASVKTNTAGVFKGFYKGRDGVGRFGGAGENALSRITADIALPYPVFSRFDCVTEIFRADAGALAGTLPPLDLLYLDPPYNQHPYGSNYFMLNLLCTYERPQQVSRVSGIPRDWNRSPYNKAREALPALMSVCRAADARYLLISFNSEGFVEKSALEAALSGLGEVTVLVRPYNAFRGSRNLRARAIHVQEYLFLVRKG